ncbi:type II toxin-antitoxin system HicA family toxin [Amycolatopsis sp. cmx-4-61]|uniref:type II toxin-antitoxin system HicA family toxin n=1 Tax=Amycolatopsis sp. cmx-4-61 TaxID=2790937 RepID=UPI00397AA834
MKQLPPWSWYLASVGALIVGLGGFLPSGSYAQATALQVGSVFLLIIPVVLAERGMLSALRQKVDESIAVQELLIETTIDMAENTAQNHEPIPETDTSPTADENDRPDEPPTAGKSRPRPQTSSRIMLRDLLRVLKEEGWEMRKSRGTHEIWAKDDNIIAIPLTPANPQSLIRRIIRMSALSDEGQRKLLKDF